MLPRTALAVLVGVVLAGPQPANLVVDGSFEEPAPGGWTPDVMAVNGNGDASSELDRDADERHVGTTSLRLSGDADTVRWSGVMQAVAVEPGRRYQLSAWMRTRDVRREGNQYVNANVFVRFEDDEGRVLRDVDGYPAVGTRPLLGTHDWTPVERVVRAPAAATVAQVGCFLSCAGVAWFDDVRLVPLEVPDWHVRDTGRYVYHWEDESPPPELVIRANEEFLASVEETLDTTLDHDVQYFYYEDNARKGAVTGVPGNAHVELHDEVHSIAWSDRHEVVHLLTRRWGRGTALLAEGLAVHLSGSWHALPVHDAAREVRDADGLLPLSELVATSSFRARDDLVTYPESGSFVGHLLETHGLAPFRAVYTNTPLEPDAATFDRLLTAAYGKDLADLEEEWLEALDAGG